MNILRSIVGIATELLDLKDPYEKPVATRVSYRMARDHNGYYIINITASNYAEAANQIDGYTVAGPVYKSLVRVGHNQWQARVECNDTHVWK